jgi:hypothetical protein
MIPGRGNAERETRLFGFSGEKVLIRVAATLRYAESNAPPDNYRPGFVSIWKAKEDVVQNTRIGGTRFTPVDLKSPRNTVQCPHVAQHRGWVRPGGG